MTTDPFTQDFDVVIPPVKPSPLGKFLGYENGWQTTPPEREKCREKRHIIETMRKGSTSLNYCPICDYYWKTESSD